MKPSVLTMALALMLFAAACSSRSTHGGTGGSGVGGAAGVGGASGAGGAAGGGGSAGGGGFCAAPAMRDGSVCVLATITGESPRGLAVRGAEVIFATQSRVVRLNKNGGDVSMALHTTGGTAIAGLTVDDAMACWSEQNSASKNLGSVWCHEFTLGNNMLIAPNQQDPFHLAGDGASIFWTVNASPGPVRRYTKSGGVKDVGTGADFPTAVAANAIDERVYWVTTGAGPAIFRAKKDNSEPPLQIYAGDALWPSNPRLVLADYLYFNQLDGVRAISTTGATPGPALEVVSGETEVGALALDGQRVYWGTAAATSAIRFQPLTGPPAKTLAPGHGPVRFMTADSEAVYWITDTVVAKVALPGAP